MVSLTVSVTNRKAINSIILFNVRLPYKDVFNIKIDLYWQYISRKGLSVSQKTINLIPRPHLGNHNMFMSKKGTH